MAPLIPPAAQRDRGLQRLRDLTFAFGAGAAALLGLFSIVAAATIPGHSDGGATAATGSSGSVATTGDGGTSFTGGSQLHRSDQGSLRPAAGAPHVVSGGSR